MQYFSINLIESSHRVSDQVRKLAKKLNQLSLSNASRKFGPNTDVQGYRSWEEHHLVENSVPWVISKFEECIILQNPFANFSGHILFLKKE